MNLLNPADNDEDISSLLARHPLWVMARHAGLHRSTALEPENPNEIYEFPAPPTKMDLSLPCLSTDMDSGDLSS